MCAVYKYFSIIISEWVNANERRLMCSHVTCNSCIAQKKCEQYWPDEGCQEYGLISVQLLDTDELPDFTIRTFLLSKVSIPCAGYVTMHSGKTRRHNYVTSLSNGILS